MSNPYRHLQVRPIAGALGAEIDGVDLSRELPAEVFEEIRRALHENLVIFFRGQRLTPQQHIDFSARFGELLEVPFVRALDGYPAILPVMKGKAETKRRLFGGLWHSDMSYAQEPPLGSALYGRVIPPYGGDTMWANMYRAYDTLSDRFKQMLDGLNAVHSAVRSYGSGGAVVNNGDPAHKMDVRTDDRAVQEVIHPVVRVHPATGRKALYVNNTYTLRFDGMTQEESEPLLQFLYEHAARPEFTCRFRWSEGALALWDNRCTQHLAMNDYDGFDREMHRTTISGIGRWGWRPSALSRRYARTYGTAIWRQRTATSRHDHRTAGLRIGHYPAVQVEHLAQRRLGHHLIGRALGRDAAVAHHDDAAGVAERQVQVVQHDDQGPAGRVQAGAEVQQVQLVADVQESGGFVQQQDAGVLRQHQRQPDALALAAGQRLHRALGEFGQLGIGQRGVDGLRVGLAP